MQCQENNNLSRRTSLFLFSAKVTTNWQSQVTQNTPRHACLRHFYDDCKINEFFLEVLEKGKLEAAPSSFKNEQTAIFKQETRAKIDSPASRYWMNEREQGGWK